MYSTGFSSGAYPGRNSSVNWSAVRGDEVAHQATAMPGQPVPDYEQEAAADAASGVAETR